MNKYTFKSIWAVFAGILTNVILSVGTDTILEWLGVFPWPWEGLFVTWMLVVALAYRIIYTIAGGYVTASLAPGNQMKHVKIVGTIGVVLTIIGIVAGWDLPDHWYPIALAIAAYPCTWLGGRLKTKGSVL